MQKCLQIGDFNKQTHEADERYISFVKIILVPSINASTIWNIKSAGIVVNGPDRVDIHQCKLLTV